MSIRSLTLTFAFSALIAACSSSHTEEIPDMGAVITFDADFTDLGYDAGQDLGADAEMPPTEGAIGAACSNSGDCADGNQCIGDFAGGYCTRDCSPTVSCPAGATCVQFGFNEYLCLDSCVAGVSPRQCREGYGCSIEAGNVCLEGCTDDTDCPGGACDPLGGNSGAGGCYTPDAGLGIPCTADSECASGGFCATEEANGYPGGACVGLRCGLEDGSGCDGDGVCIDGGNGGVCFDGCNVNEDCRDGFRCEADSDFPDRKYCTAGCTSNDDCTVIGNVCNTIAGTCAPPFNPSELGAACSMSFDICTGGACLRETTSGFPRSYCIYLGCTPGVADELDGCPGAGVCTTNRTGTSTYCLEPCETSTDCRAEYACKPVDPSNAESPTACMPGCDADSDCQNAMRRGWICNNGTGLCQAPFDTSALGVACDSSDDCEGGLCATESFDGYPGGQCVATGCRLSGDGPSEPCPGTSVCVAGNTIDPSLGICVPSCSTTAPLPCREGYACEPISEGSTSGACRAACTETSCTGGRTCNSESGLCVLPV